MFRQHRKSIVLFVSTIILTVLITTMVIQATGVVANTFVISSGLYPGAPTYTIWVEGDSYFAKNAYGQLMYSDTNFSFLITQVMGMMTLNPSNGRGNIYIASGNYSVDSTISPLVGIDIYGSNVVGTTLRWTGSTNGTMLSYITSGAGQLRNIEINCMNLSNGVYVNGGWSHQFSDVPIYHPYEFGLYVTGTDNDYYHNVYVQKVNPVTSGNYSIKIDSTTALTLSNCVATGTDGLQLQYSLNAKIIGGEYEQVDLYRDENVFCYGMDVESQYHDRAIIISGDGFGTLGPYTLIANCIANDNINLAAFIGLRIDTDTNNVLVEGNWFLDQSGIAAMTLDFEICDTASYITVIYNSLWVNAWSVAVGATNVTISGNSP
jgi:hypothetical protein